MPNFDPFNLACFCLRRAALSTPEKTALIVIRDIAVEAERWTFAELDRIVRAIAAGLLQRGLGRGDRLLIRLPNDTDYALTFFGAVAAGLVPVPLSAQLTDSEAALLLEDSRAAAMVEVMKGPVSRCPHGVCGHRE